MSIQFSAIRGLGFAVLVLAAGLCVAPAARAQIFVDFNNAEFTVPEGDTAEITVTITAAPPAGATFRVDFATMEPPADPPPYGTATAPADYTAVSGELVFDANTTTRSFFVQTRLDDRIECNETVILRLSNPRGGVELGTQNNPAVLVIQDEAPPTATLDVSDQIRDTEGLLPLGDWVPLFCFTITTAEDAPAFRRVADFVYTIKGDPEDERPYDRIVSPPPRDLIQEFGLFQDFPDPGQEEPDCVLDYTFPHFDDRSVLRFTWDNTGAPYGTENNGTYNLNFFTNGYLLNPGGPWPGTSGVWIVAVRTSPYWYNMQTLSCDVNFIRMLDQYGDFPRACESPFAPVDSYPNDGVPPFLVSEISYSASFGSALDITSGPTMPFQVEYAQAWNWPNFMYTPTAEYLRPRFDRPGNFFDLVTGEWMDLRNLFALETWVPLIGIDLHGGAGTARLDEVNVVFTDIGADPLVPGSGGFDPRTGLDTVTTESNPTGSGNPARAVGNDYAFSGVWVFHDTNGNGIFDQPVKTTNAGVTFTDYPLFPGFGSALPGQQVSGLREWQYLGFPPDGGDPWWKIKLRFGAGRRRLEGDTPTGYLDPTPDPFTPTIPSSFFSDYFVVIRPDSGYQDVSLMPGDGTGLAPGADFRAFIEPRRYNAFKGYEDGGIHTTAQIMPVDGNFYGPGIAGVWQNDPQWTATEPWWPQRTQNQHNTKPVRQGLDIHDLVLTYNSNSSFARMSDIGYDTASFLNAIGLSFAGTSYFDEWMDPLGGLQSQFFHGHSVGVVSWVMHFTASFSNVALYSDDVFTSFQIPYETAPFFNTYFDDPAFASPTRSIFFSRPPAQPSLPEYATWPTTLPPGMYPEAANWAPGDRKARILKQHIEPNSQPTAILGINIVGVDDPVTNRIAPVSLNRLTVAFYGPDFTPSDLRPLDREGISSSSGLLLYEDGDSTGTFGGALGADRIVPLKELAWRTLPERIDLDGDGVADDLNGDGVVNDSDRAWVLTLTLNQAWQAPISDERTGGGLGTGGAGGGGAKVGDGEWGMGNDDTPGVEGILSDGNNELGLPTLARRAGRRADDAENREKGLDVVSAHLPDPNPIPPQGPSSKTIHSIDLDEVRARMEERAAAKLDSGEKALAPGGNQGDDLFVVIQTSNTVKRFEQFRAVVPASLPDRPVSERSAGVRLLPTAVQARNVFVKFNPEEGPVQDYYRHDMIEVNVPTEIVDLITAGQTIAKNSSPVAVLGIDCSTNRGADGMAATGTNGVGAAGAFTVPTAAWTPGAFAGYWLIDGNYEAFQITGNTATALTLLSGAPKSGFYIIAKDPTFLEQAVVELYDQGNDGAFYYEDDLMPLDIDQTKSGLAIYRDNDQDPSNRNGQFDPGVDIPLKLNAAPYLSALAGEPPTQIRFVFSAPGTDNQGQGGVLAPLATQPRYRQWVPDSFGVSSADPFGGPDFFIVIRTSNNLAIGDDFSFGIVSWGPNTPTEPDPDTFPPFPQSLRKDEYDVFSEFPWGSRAIGYITFFKDPAALDPPDITGFNWVRSTVSVAKQTNVLRGAAGGISPGGVVIASASRTVLPVNVGPGGLTFSIVGSGFGTAPVVTLGAIDLIVTAATDTLINVTIPGGSTVLGPPVILTVRNPLTGNQAARDDLFTLTTDPIGDVEVVITSVSRSALPRTVPAGGLGFTITGSGFGTLVRVTLQGMNLLVNNAVNTSISVTIPANTVFTNAPLTLTVTNLSNGRSATRDGLFTFALVPGIFSVSPNRGTSSNFPVRVQGNNFEDPQVLFGDTLLPRVSSTATEIVVGFPTGGLPKTGLLDVTVVNGSTTSAVLPSGFFYENLPVGPPRACFIATAAYGTPLEGHLEAFRGFRDAVLLKSAAGAALVNAYYTVSPSVADVVALHPWLAALVRMVLTPVAWCLEAPVLLGVLVILVLAWAVRRCQLPVASCQLPVAGSSPHSPLSTLHYSLSTIRATYRLSTRGVSLVSARTKLMTLLGLLAFFLTAQHAAAFYPIGGFDLAQQLIFPRWPLSYMDTNRDGDVRGDDEGVPITFESGALGWTNAQINTLKEAFETWEAVPTSFAAFRYTDSVRNPPDPLETSPDIGSMDSINYVAVQRDGESQDIATGLGGITLITTVIETTLIEIEGELFEVPAGQILDVDIILDGTLSSAVLKGHAMTQVGFMLGLSISPMQNFAGAGSAGPFFEDPVMELRGADGRLLQVGVTPTMFPLPFFYTAISSSRPLPPGARTFADFAFRPPSAKTGTETASGEVLQASSSAGAALSKAVVYQYCLRGTPAHTYRACEGRNDELFSKASRGTCEKWTPLGENFAVNLEATELFTDRFTDGSYYVSLAAVRSSGAFGLRMQADFSAMRPAEELWVLAPNSGASFGPFHAEDDVAGGRWLPSVEGDTAVLMVRSTSPELPLVQLTGISHFFRPLYDVLKELECNINIACESDPAIQQISTGIGILLITTDTGTGACSGSLINNPDSAAFEPFYITANHCIGNNAEAIGSEVIWDFRASACNVSDAPDLDNLPRSDVAALLATSGTLDGTLLLLRDVPVGPLGRAYLGWDIRVPGIGEAIIGIHHPDATHMRISYGEITGINQAEPDLGWTRQTSVVWDQGVTEGGSSGSPLLFHDGRYRLLGMLSNGATHTCGDDRSGNTDNYASFRDFFLLIGGLLTSSAPPIFERAGQDARVDLAPDDIAGVTFMYPRRAEEVSFNITQEVRTRNQLGLPSVPVAGALITAWCDVDGDPVTPRVPIISTLSSLYEIQPATRGRFNLLGLPKQLESSAKGLFDPTYTVTAAQLSIPGDIASALFDSTHGGVTNMPGRPGFSFATGYASEVFHETGNLFGAHRFAEGTPLRYDRVRRKVVSVNTSRTLDSIRPNTTPMFGDPTTNCPLALASAGLPTQNGPAALRAFRDQYLLPTAVGAALADLYYRAAPLMAEYLLEHAYALNAARWAARALEWAIAYGRPLAAAGLLTGLIILGGLSRMRHRVRHTTLLLAVGAALALGGEAQAQMKYMSTPRMVAVADDIVTGKVVSVESRWAEKRRIVTDITIQVDDTIKGAANKGGYVNLRQPGGRVGAVVTYAVLLPEFKEGEEVLVFLENRRNTVKNADAGPLVVSGSRGKLEIKQDTGTGAKYVVGSTLEAQVGLKDAAAEISKGKPNTDKTGAEGQEARVLLEDLKQYLRTLAREQKKQ